MSAFEDRPREPAEDGLLLSEEEARVSVRTYPYERVRISRRVVTEVREIEVRREELVVERVPLDGEPVEDGAVDLGTGDGVDWVLRYEEVELSRRLVPYERVRVRRERVDREVPVEASLRVERARVDEER